MMAKHYPILLAVDESLAQYCGDLTKDCRAEYKLLNEAAMELAAQLTPHNTVKGLRVAAHLMLAAWVTKKAMGAAVSTYATFLSEFGDELLEQREAARRAASRSGRGSTRTAGGMRFLTEEEGE